MTMMPKDPLHFIRLAGLAGTLSALLASAAAAPLYSVSEPRPELVDPLPYDINDKGWMLLSALNKKGTRVALRCTPAGCETVPGLLGSKKDVFVHRLDKTGRVVGSAPNGQPGVWAHPILFDGAQTTDLGALAQDDCGGCSLISWASDINDKGQIVGASATAGGELRAVLWEGGAITELPTLGGASSVAAAINRKGTIVGHSETLAGQENHAFLYRNGKMRDLGVLGTGIYSWANDVNSLGQVVGGSTTDGANAVRPFIYRDGVMSEMPAPASHAGVDVFRINDAGWAVGVYLPDGERDGHGWVYDGTASHDLNDTLTAADQALWLIRNTAGINDAGQILAHAYKRSDGTLHVLVLTPQEAAASTRQR